MPRPTALVLGLLTLSVVSLPYMTGAGFARADVNDLRSGEWSGGAGAGFLANTPDGTEFALKGHVDYFLLHGVSAGLLGQHAFGGNDSVLGVSAQAKYWWSIPGTLNRGTLVVQGGIGFVWADIEDTDSGVANIYTSFLIPVGVGIDYAVTRRVAVTAELLVNFTSLGEDVQVDGREFDLHTNIMPAFYLGVRF